MASHLARNPAVAKVSKVLGRLPAARLVAFFDRHVGREPDAQDVLMSGIAASGAADRMARAQVFGRVTMRPASTRWSAPAKQWPLSAPETAHEGFPRPPSRRRARGRIPGDRPDHRQRILHHPRPERRQCRDLTRLGRRHGHPETPERQELHLPRQVLQRHGPQCRHQPPEPDDPLERHREPDLQQADLDLAKHDRQGAVRDHPHRLQDGLPRRQHARRRPLLPEDLDRRRRPDDHVDRRGKHRQRQNLDHRQRRGPTGYSITSLLGLY